MSDYVQQTTIRPRPPRRRGRPIPQPGEDDYDPEYDPTIKLVVETRGGPKEEFLQKMGVKARDYFYDGSYRPVKPVWRQQHPTVQGTDGRAHVVVTRPKTPQPAEYVDTPPLTPNGSIIWGNQEGQAESAKGFEEPKPISIPAKSPTVGPRPLRRSGPTLLFESLSNQGSMRVEVTITPINSRKRQNPPAASSGNVREPKRLRLEATIELPAEPRYHLRTRQPKSYAELGRARAPRSRTKTKAEATSKTIRSGLTVSISCGPSKASLAAGPSARVLRTGKTAKVTKPTQQKSRSRRS
mgnify:CR=1 FL=1